MTSREIKDYLIAHQKEMTESDKEDALKELKSRVTSPSRPQVSTYENFRAHVMKGDATNVQGDQLLTYLKDRPVGGTSSNSNGKWDEMTSREIKDYLIAHQKEMTESDKEDALKELKSRVTSSSRPQVSTYENFRAHVMKGDATNAQGDQLLTYLKDR